MKRYFLLALVALGLLAIVPQQAEARVHFDVSIGVPGFCYGPGYYSGYDPGYYPGYNYGSYYGYGYGRRYYQPYYRSYRPYYYRRYYHHRHWR